MKKRNSIVILLIVILLLTACSTNVENGGYQVSKVIKIERIPNIADYTDMFKGIKSLPQISLNETFEIDIRSSDISSDDIMDRYDDLLYTTFDSKTKWPKNLPNEFNPEKVMELYKDPGLNVRQLHDKGITGKGVGIAIIDQTLLVDHVEYKDNLKFYEEYDVYKTIDASMHGAAVASIAVGKTVGVAPDADLYYIAGPFGEKVDGKYVFDYTYIANYIDRFLEINEDLPKDRKIRVISIARGWSRSEKGYTEVMDAVKRANEKGIFVISSSLSDTNGYNFNGLGKKPLADSNDINSFVPGSWWKDMAVETLKRANYVMAPMDFRCTASPTGQEDYVVYAEGGWSWTIPYLAGVYALACQVNPEITYNEFWETSISTGDTIKLKNYNNIDYDFGKIINPLKLIEEVKNKDK